MTPESLYGYDDLGFSCARNVNLNLGIALPNHYTLTTLIGAGAMGMVYRAIGEHTMQDVELWYTMR